MKENLSVCGAECRECEYQKKSQCEGCSAVKGKAWGCHCVGLDTCPKHIEEMLNEDGSGSYQVLNAGSSGYSSYQGLQQLKHVVTKYSPDLVTVFFGWNDHWFSSRPDRLVRIKEDWEIDLINLLEQLRIYQLYHWAVARFKEKVLKSINKEPLKTFRVSPSEYRENLEAMADFCRGKGIPLTFITAPFDETQLEPSPVFPLPREALVKTHMTYNNIVRQVALSRQIPLIDLEMALFQITQKKSIPFPFFSDGIHFNMLGCKIAAGLIVDSLRRLSLVQDSGKEKVTSPS